MMTDTTPHSAECKNHTEIPNRWEGVKTEYELFDGFREASYPWKVAYVMSIVALFPLVPVLMEFFQHGASERAARYATEAIDSGECTPCEKHEHGHEHGKDKSREHEKAPSHKAAPDAPEQLRADFLETLMQERSADKAMAASGDIAR